MASVREAETRLAARVPFPLAGTGLSSKSNGQHTCVCGEYTLSNCRHCGEPACGKCLETPRHAERFHVNA